MYNHNDYNGSKYDNKTNDITRRGKERQQQCSRCTPYDSGNRDRSSAYVTLTTSTTPQANAREHTRTEDSARKKRDGEKPPCPICTSHQRCSTCKTKLQNWAPEEVTGLKTAVIKTDINTSAANSAPPATRMDRGLTGLVNIGNTCYMNTALQCLSNTGPLTDRFLTNGFILNCTSTSKQIAVEYGRLVNELWSKKYYCISPRHVKNAVACRHSRFSNTRQEDSMEFLRFLLQGLHDDLNEANNQTAKGKKCRNKSEQRREQKYEIYKRTQGKSKTNGYVRKQQKLTNDVKYDKEAGEMAWQMHKTANDSVIVDLFHGQYKTTFTCMGCGKRTVNFEVFLDLSLDIPESRSCDLSECLENISTVEELSGPNQLACDFCKTLQDAKKQMVIWKLPPVVIIAFRRFYFDDWFQLQKNYSEVHFPLENLDLNRYIPGKCSGKKYNLTAVSMHNGSLQGGHYYAVCKPPGLRKWFIFNDSTVTETSESSLESSLAYYLFYMSSENTVHLRQKDSTHSKLISH